MAEQNDKARTRVAERIAEVRARFVAGLCARTSDLAELSRRAAQADPGAEAARDALRLGLHNLAGASPTLGLRGLGRRAAALEARLMSAPGGPLAPDFAEALARDVEALSANPD